MRDNFEEAWSALRRSLERRGRELHDEVRSYPTPIARCDVQLTQVIAERDAALAQLRQAGGLDEARATGRREEWLARVRAFTAGLELADREAAGARERLLAALER